MAASARRSRARTTASISTSSRAGLGERWETMGIALKFYSCVGSNHTTLDAIRDDAGAASVHARRGRQDRRARLAGHGRSRRLAVPAARASPRRSSTCRSASPRCCSRATCFVDQFTDAVVADDARIALVAQGRASCTTPPSPRCGSTFRHKVRVEVHFHDGSREIETRRSAARQRTVVRHCGRDRRQVPQAYAQRNDRAAAGGVDRGRSRYGATADEQAAGRVAAAAIGRATMHQRWTALLTS